MMIELSTIRTLLRHGDWANGQLIDAAVGLSQEQLDKIFDIGRGTLRKTLLHILAGESVWLARWGGLRDTPWPDEDEKAMHGIIRERFCELTPRRDRFLDTLRREDLGRAIVYRDSKGSLFSASLSDMMIQMCHHSTHHRAQAVNILRRLGVKAPELDYMMWVRKPA